MKLLPELIPDSSWYENVRTKVPAAKWKAIKKKVAKDAGKKCQICGGVGPKWPVECHEIWHFDESTQIQKLTGLIALCPSCHMVKHIGLAEVQGKLHEAFAHLMAVNDCTKDEAVTVLAESFGEWNTRSQIQWTVDISYIDTLEV